MEAGPVEENEKPAVPSVSGASLVDLSDISLADVDGLGGNALAHSLRRVLSEVDDPDESVTGFNSSI